MQEFRRSCMHLAFPVVVLCSIGPAAFAGDVTAVGAYLNLLSSGKLIYLDAVEHGKCGTGIFAPWDPVKHVGSTCKKTASDSGDDADWPGLIEAIRVAGTVSGGFAYSLPTEPPPGVDLSVPAGIHTAKFSTSHPTLLNAQFPADGSPGIVRYSAYYYIASGFDDTAWHIQMQWKGINPGYGNQNPKIAWGFHQLGEAGNLTRQIQLTVRDATPGLCEQRFDTFTRADIGMPPLPVPAATWVKVTIEIKFAPADGYVKIWQGESGSETLVVGATQINTVSQLIREADYLSNDANTGSEQQCRNTLNDSFYWSDSGNFAWGVTNYLSTLSYVSSNRTDPAEPNHVLLVDDIEITKP